MNKNVSKGGLVISSAKEAQSYLQKGVGSYDNDVIKQALMHLNLEALNDTGLKTKLLMHASAFVSCMSKNQDLYKCSAQSLAGAFLRTFEAGLSVSPEARECYLVPYGGSAQVQVGYIAYTARIAKQGNFVVVSEVVLQGEVFEPFEYVDGRIKHRHKTRPDRNKYQDQIIGAYAVLKSQKTGATLDFCYLSWAEIDSLRMRNKSQAGGKKQAWATDTAAMSQAKAIKQLVLRSTACLELTSIDERTFVQDAGGDVLEAEIYEDAEQIEIQPTAQQDWKQISKDVLASWEKAETPKEKNAIRKDFFAKLTAANLPDAEKIAIRPFFEKIPQQSE